MMMYAACTILRRMVYVCSVHCGKFCVYDGISHVYAPCMMVYTHPGSDLEVHDWTSESGIVKAGGVRHVPEVALVQVITGA
jgi:hypothetical protein